MPWLQMIGVAECVLIILLSEPVLNRMSPCAPLLIRMTFHAIAMGSAIRLYHILAGHPPSWSALLQVGGLAALLLFNQLRRIKATSRRQTERKSECRPRRFQESRY